VSLSGNHGGLGQLKKQLRPELPTLPERMERLPIDPRGYPVPAFVADVNGEPDFRVASAAFKENAQLVGLCYVCGLPFTTRHRWFVIGPMSVVNRTTSEPAVHRECAIFSVQGCPFLMRPHAMRRENALPESGFVDEASIARNPGVTALYSTRNVEVYRRSREMGRFLLFLSDPEEVQWYAKGRKATRYEVLASIQSGYNLLLAEAEKEGKEALFSLFQSTERVFPILPRRNNDSDDDQGDAFLLQMGEMMAEAVKKLP
jgi:hypothetical protein